MRQVSSTPRLGPGPRTEQPKDAGPRPPQAYAVVRRGWARAEDAGMRRSSGTALGRGPPGAQLGVPLGTTDGPEVAPAADPQVLAPLEVLDRRDVRDRVAEPCLHPTDRETKPVPYGLHALG